MTTEPNDMKFDDALLDSLLGAAGEFVALATATMTEDELAQFDGKRQAVLVQASPLIARLLVYDETDAPAREVARLAGSDIPAQFGDLIGTFGVTALNRARDGGQQFAAVEAVRMIDEGMGLDLCVLIENRPASARVLITHRDGDLSKAVELAKLVAAS